MNIRYLDIDELNERLEELTALKEAVQDAETALAEAETDEEKEEASSDLEDAKIVFSVFEIKELEALEELKNDIGESRGKISEDGGPFIHCDDFVEYAQELAEEIGALDLNASWPMTCIDWDKAAKELSADYSVITWDGNDYYFRA
jgi:hypothetical protein